MRGIWTAIAMMVCCGLAHGQSTMHYLPMNPGAVAQTGKWTVANSGANFLITNPDGTTATVAKAAALTQTVNVFSLPANSRIEGCTIKTGTAFAGTTTLTGTVGITGSLTGCISSAYDLKAAVSNTNFSAATPSAAVVSFTGTDSLTLALTATVSNLSALSAGSVTIWMTWQILP